MKKDTFQTYLLEKGLALSTIGSIVRSVTHFEIYLKLRDKTLRMVSHNIAIEYINYLKKTARLQPRTINLKLSHLKYYYRHLNSATNPFESLTIRGERHKIQIGLLNGEQLENIFHLMSEATQLDRRAKVLASFYLFQGITTTELLQLKVEHLELQTGQIHIIRTLQSNPRKLPLHPAQLFVLMKVILSGSYQPSDLLFQCLGEGKQGKQVTRHLRQSLKHLDGYKSLRHIRHSVIMNWIKSCNLRQVQYNAGHRYISSTEKFLQNDISALKLAIMEKHPLNW